MIFSYLAIFLAGTSWGFEAPVFSTSTILPTYLSLAASINDFGRFADSGSDANWFIGFNNAWIIKLPPAPLGDFSRAFIGAKIGRAKTRPNVDKPWLRELIAGKVYMGVSQTPSFTAEQSFFLAETSDLPLEPDAHAYLEGVGGSDWFWAEVPRAMVSFSQPNYLIVWSPTQHFVRASSAPILAAAPVEDSSPRETRAWNNHSISGVPPRNAATALETPINSIYPALAIKLVPSGSEEIAVTEFSAQRAGKRYVASFSVSGENIDEAWVESSRDQLDWERITRLQRRQPFLFSLPADKVGAGLYLRGAARNVSGVTGQSEPSVVPYGP